MGHEVLVAGPLPPREEIVRIIQEIDPQSDTSDPAWVRVTGADFSVEVNLSGEEPLTQFACHVRGADPALGFVGTLLERLQLRALDPGSTSGFAPAAAAASMARWRDYRDQVMAEPSSAAQTERQASGFPCIVIAR